MAAFSYQQQNYPYFLDNNSVFMPNNSMKMSGNFVDELGNTINPNYFPNQFYQLPEEFPTLDHHGNYQNSIDTTNNNQSSKVTMSDNENNSVTKKQSTTETSTVVSTGEQVSQNPVQKKRRTRNGPRSNSAQSKEGGEVKSKRARKVTVSEEKQSKAKTEKKISEEEPKGFIHVRARRGQATDSHSLAERVRREKISERMKILQRLVPGCDKVTGKALMLDEIINYVQSLQNQVEFLSMKLASVNPMFYDFGVDLDSFMVRPAERGVNNMSPVQQCSQTTVLPPPLSPTATTTTTTAAAAINFLTTTNSYPLLDHNNPPFSQDNGSIMWDVEEDRRKFVNPSVAAAVFSNNLCSFH